MVLDYWLLLIIIYILFPSGEGVVEKFVENGIVTDLNLPDAPDTVCTVRYVNS